jgi:hypothetical protein
VVLLKQDPPDVDRAYLERAQRYQSESRGSPHSRESDSEWDAFLAASTRNGRLGSELKGDVRDAYQRYVRLVGQMAGEEGALDSAAGVLYDLLRGAARGAQGERRDVHGFDYGMQRLSLLVVTRCVCALGWSGEPSARAEFERLLQHRINDADWSTAKALVEKLAEWAAGMTRDPKGKGRGQ